MRHLGLEADEGHRQAYMDNYSLGLGGILQPGVVKALGIEIKKKVLGNLPFDYVKEYLTGVFGSFIGKASAEEYMQNYFLLRFGVLLPYEQNFSQTVSREDIVAGYRLFFGRDPENMAVVESMADSCKCLFDLRKVFFLSSEFAVTYEAFRKL